MAPRDERFERRRGISNGRRNRNACTNAGVNRHRPPNTESIHRVRASHRRPAHLEPSRAPVNAPTGPSLASRIIYGRGRGEFQRGAGTTPRPQNVGRLQDRITRPSATNGTGRDANTTNLQVNHRTQGPNMSVFAANDGPNRDSRTNPVVETVIDHLPFNDAQVDRGNYLSQNPIFADSQPPQFTGVPLPLSLDTGLAKHARPARPIRMFNEPIIEQVVPVEGKDEPSPPRRPVYTYRGKDPIKRLVSNPKLQAVLAGKAVPAERKKHKDDRMDLRMGVSRVMK